MGHVVERMLMDSRSPVTGGTPMVVSAACRSSPRRSTGVGGQARRGSDASPSCRRPPCPERSRQLGAPAPGKQRHRADHRAARKLLFEQGGPGPGDFQRAPVGPGQVHQGAQAQCRRLAGGPVLGRPALVEAEAEERLPPPHAAPRTRQAARAPRPTVEVHAPGVSRDHPRAVRVLGKSGEAERHRNPLRQDPGELPRRSLPSHLDDGSRTSYEPPP